MTTDPPKLDNRDEFIEWMEGRVFKFNQSDSDIHFKATGKREEQNKHEVPTGVAEAKTVYLEYTVMETDTVSVRGVNADAEVTVLKEPEDTETEKVGFDSIRVQYLRGEITEL